jgi:tetratricopeptide (TPR) repeat protein
MWSNTYDRAATDVLSIQDQIASAIIDEGIRLRLSGDQRRRLLRKPTNDPAAFELYLRAIQAFEKATEADYLGARDLLRQAIARDRSFSLAYVALATTYSLMAIDGYERPADTWPEVSQNVRRALDWDPDLPDAHSEAATALFFSQWDWPGAEREWNRALQSRGGGFVPDFLRARALQSWALGRPDEALALIRKSRELDPLSFGIIVSEADYLLQTAQLDNAASLYENVIRTEPGASNAYFGLAEVRRAQGRFDEAIEARRRGYAAAGDDSLTKVLSSARGAEGYREVERAAARLELERLETRTATGYASPLDFARACAQLGEKDRAFSYFPAAFEDRAPGLVFLKVDHAWDAVRDDPRFLAAVHRVGLP